jgi:hypothetical protein
MRLADGDCAALAAYLETCPGIAGVRIEGGAVHARCDESGINQAELLRKLVERGFPIIAFHETEADLEDVFMRVTRGIVS